MSELRSYFATAKACARLATEMCLSFKAESVPSVRKGDKTWVTQADLQIEKELRLLLAKAHPTHKILGEEEGGEIARGEEEYTWVLDPIDGTFSFVHGIPFYSSLIALLKGNKPVIGIACLPAMGVQMSAIAGEGVWINDEPYVRSALVGQHNIEVVATADPYRFRMEGQTKVLEHLYAEPFRARTYPDALGYYFVLQGHVRAFVDPKVEVWDVAPFHVIFPEAGFAIHTWNEPHPEQATLQRGTSVAYALGAAAEQKSLRTPLQAPLNCSDVLDVLRGQ